MTNSEALWEVFRATGHIGAYLLYKDFSDQEALMDGHDLCRKRQLYDERV